MERESTRGFLFPLKRDVIQTVMIEIAQDPESLGVHSEESIIMERLSPTLKYTLLMFAFVNAGLGEDTGVLQDDTNQLLEGALWIHKILRKQADRNGFELQKVPEESTEVFLQNIDDDPSGESVDGWAKQAEQNGLSADYLTEFAEGRPFRRLGVLTIFRFFKGLEDAKNLERKLGF